MEKVDSKSVKRKVTLLLHRALEEGTVTEKNDPGRVKHLRVSSFPFCGVAWFLSLPHSTAKKKSVPSTMRFYTSVGHAVHDTFQTTLSKLDMEDMKTELVADWKCSECGHIEEFCVKPRRCPKCKGKELLFRECTVADDPILGHIDTILKIHLGKGAKEIEELKSKFGLLIVDYKTTNTKKIGKDYLASGHNRSQIKAYVAILKKQGKPMLPFAVLAYVPRDDPNNFECVVVPVNYEKENAKIKYYKRQFKRAVAASTREDFVELVDMRPCAEKLKSAHSFCKWRNHCAGEGNRKTVIKEMEAVAVKMKGRLPIKDWVPE